MRAAMWTAALLVGLCLAGRASAGGVAVTGSAVSPGISNASPGVGLTSFIRGGFGLTNLFSHYRMTAKNQLAGPSSIPDPNTPDYFKAFGYQRLGNQNPHWWIFGR
jgi:hypothetical protein